MNGYHNLKSVLPSNWQELVFNWDKNLAKNYVIHPQKIIPILKANIWKLQTHIVTAQTVDQTQMNVPNSSDQPYPQEKTSLTKKT